MNNKKCYSLNQRQLNKIMSDITYLMEDNKVTSIERIGNVIKCEYMNEYNNLCELGLYAGSEGFKYAEDVSQVYYELKHYYKV